MLQRFPTLLFLFFATTITLTAQTSSNYLSREIDKANLKQPQPQNFQPINWEDVDLYTGKINVHIPLFEINSGDLTMPISLQYSNQGIALNRIASSVGMGWNLNTGGSVNKEVRDVDDHEIALNALFQPGVGQQGILNDYLSLKPQNHNYNVFCEPTHLDSSPDFYHMNIANGDKSKFILKFQNRNLNSDRPFENEDSTFRTVFIDGSSYKGENIYRERLNEANSTLGFNSNLITYLPHYPVSQGRPIDTKSFTLTNPSGIKYSFNDFEYYESAPSYTGPRNSIIITGDTLPPKQNHFIVRTMLASGPIRSKINKWVLTDMEDLKRGNRIQLEYEKYVKKMVYKTPFYNKYVYSERVDANDIYFGYYPDILHPSYEYDFYGTNKPYFLMRKPQNQRIKEIKWDGGSVKFEYHHNRMDEPDEKALTDIKVYNSNSQLVKHFQFSYFYSYSKENCAEWNCKRLFLQNIKQISNDGQQKIDLYSFEYHLNNPLPKVNSLEYDFLGYYNNNALVESDFNDLNNFKTPVLFYKENFSRLSLEDEVRKRGPAVLPFFPKTNYDYLLTGQYSLEANTNSLLGLLTKIKHQYGGTTEFTYENNSFLYEGREITAGGGRVAKQVLKDSDGSIRKAFNYQYAGGNLFKIPSFGLPWIMHLTDKYKIAFSTHTKNRVTPILINGSQIGYSNVKVSEQNNGNTQYLFSNSTPIKDLKPELTKSSYLYDEGYNLLHNATPFTDYIDNTHYDNYLGNLLEKTVYTEAGNPIQKEIFKYNIEILDKEIITARRIFNTKAKTTAFSRLKVFDSEYRYIKFGDNSTFEYKTTLNYERKLLTNKLIYTYSDNLDRSSFYVNGYAYTYHSKYPLIEKIRKYSYPTVLTEDLNLYDSETEYTYSHELKDPTLQNLVHNNNILSIPISEKEYDGKTGKMKFEKKYNFNTSQYGQFLTTSIEENISPGAANTLIHFDRYDHKGNLEEYHPPHGIYTNIIWDSGFQSPSVKIEGPKSNQINTQLFNLAILSTLNLLNDPLFKNIQQQLPNARITGYIYKPLIGLSQVIHPNGHSDYYEYDAFGRLITVKNNYGEILNSYEYNHKH